MNSFFERIAQYTDVLFALSVIGMISVMLIPMPPGLLDLLLAFNIAFSLLVLLMTLITIMFLDAFMCKLPSQTYCDRRKP